MGRRYSEVLNEIKQVPFKVVESTNGDVRVMAQGKEYSPPQISAFILQKLKKRLKITWAKRLKKLSSLFQLISMMLRERRLRMLEQLLDWMWSE